MQATQGRLQRDLETNAQFGALDEVDGHGRTVLTGTDANRDARQYLIDRFEDAGLTVTVDAVGTMVGRWTPDSADPSAAPVATGSHLDSVPVGGIFDGPLGVYGGLEAVRTLQEADWEPNRPIDVVCFTEEEGGRFGNGLLGSSVATGRLDVEEALAFEDASGTTLESALDRIGFQGEGVIDASEWDAWLELHIEQGRTLERHGNAVGVVSTISGITHCYLDLRGEANHAGSTPMESRADALTAASEIVLDLESAARRHAQDRSSSAVATVGHLEATPNATNVVPGTVSLGIDIRDVTQRSIETLVSRLENSAREVEHDRPIETELARPYDVAPETMATRCQNALESASSAVGVEPVSMHSGAAHDTMNVSRVTDAGLLFAPSAEGVSHNPNEWTDWADCATAVTVLAEALSELAET